jgi:hypothetical protein
MPLNVQNKEFVTLDDESGPKPILHEPKKSYPVFKYIFQGAFIVLVVASAVFLVYTIALKQLGVEPTPSEAVVTPAVDTSTIAQAEGFPPSEQPVVSPIEQPVGEPSEQPVPEPTKKPPTEEVKPPVEEVKLPVEKPVTHPKVSLTQGSYTVYIAAYNMKSPAEEEVGRWIEAGYEAMVVESAKNFRVAIGQYVTADDAKIFAQQMWEAFENGYWIGRVP